MLGYVLSFTYNYITLFHRHARKKVDWTTICDYISCVCECVSTYLISVRAIAPAERLILRGNVSRKVGCGLGGQRCRYIKKIGVKAAPICVLLFLNPLVTQHQIYQVFFFPARVDGDVMEQQVLPQVPHSQAHEPWPLECCCL